MSKGKDIIDWEVIHLKDQFETIREKIEHHEKFGDLRKICAFNEPEKTLKFKTVDLKPFLSLPCCGQIDGFFWTDFVTAEASDTL